ncbi:MAG TPA: hypothetical protein VJX92_17045 [Methylomirabilota bacterium]|nr:hypothetical protein [Methylomirabilota bacterium]
MTIREYLRRRKRWALVIVNLGVLVFIGGAAAGAQGATLFVLAALAFLICGLGGAFLSFRVRCPRCGERIGQVLGRAGGPSALPKGLQCCPFCGVALEDPVPDRQAP